MIEQDGVKPIVVSRTPVGKPFGTEYGGQEVMAQQVQEVVVGHPKATLSVQVGPEEWKEGPDESTRVVTDILEPVKQ